MSALLVLLYLIGLHTEIDAPFHIPCNFFLCGIVGLLMLVRWRHRATKPQVYALVGINLVSLATVVLSPNASALWVEGFKAWLQLSYSLTVAYGLYLELSTWQISRLSRWAGIAIIICLVGFTLEILLPPFKAFSDIIRIKLAGDSGVFLYGVGDKGGGVWSIERDLELAGHIRPNFFAKEPSHAAYTLVLIMMVWYGLSSMKYKPLLYAGALIIAMKLTGSPTMLCAGAVLAATWVDDLLTPGIGRRAWRIKLAVGLASTVVAAGIAMTLFGSRFFSKEADMSTCLRTTLPYQMVLWTFREYPAFGIGLGEFENCQDVARQGAINLAVDRGLAGEVVDDGGNGNMLCNAFCEIPMYYGMIGSLPLLYYLIKVVKHFGTVGYCYSAIIICALLHAFGCMMSVRGWTSLMLIQIIMLARFNGRSQAVPQIVTIP